MLDNIREWFIDFWEEIPVWVVALVAVVGIAGIYFALVAFDAPAWTRWGLWACLGGGGLLSGARIVVSRFQQ